MFTTLRIIPAIVLLGLTAATSPRAFAGLLPTHAAASTVLYNGGSITTYLEGNGSLDTGLQVLTDRDHFITGQAWSSPDSNHLLGASSYAKHPLTPLARRNPHGATSSS